MVVLLLESKCRLCLYPHRLTINLQPVKGFWTRASLIRRERQRRSPVSKLRPRRSSYPGTSRHLSREPGHSVVVVSSAGACFVCTVPACLFKELSILEGPTPCCCLICAK